MPISSAQCRAARALLDWSQKELSELSKLSLQTVVQFERGKRVLRERTLDDLCETFERAGIAFLDAQDGICGQGVQLRAGFEPITREDSKKRRASGSEDDVGEVGAVDLSLVDVTDEDREPPAPLMWSEADQQVQTAYWRAQPEKWASLHEVSRQALLYAMERRRLFAED